MAGKSAQVASVPQASVSVVIPCYCCIDTVSRAVESVFNQTLRPLEVILVDDASPDQTVFELNSLVSQYPDGWIKVIALDKNSGPGIARNVGWDNAAGHYVAFLDADDTWRRHKIELQYNWLVEHPEAVMLGQRYDVVLLGPRYMDGASLIEILEASSFKCVTSQMLLRRNYWSTSSVMLRRDQHFRFREGRRYSEDYQLWCDMCFSGEKCFVTDSPMFDAYKAVYGESGLSSQLWRMERGELRVLKSLRSSKYIGTWTYMLVCTWSLLKYARRTIKSLGLNK